MDQTSEVSDTVISTCQVQIKKLYSAHDAKQLPVMIPSNCNENEQPMVMTPSPSSSENDNSDRDPDYSPGQADTKLKHIARTLAEQDGHVEDDDEDDHVEDDDDNEDDDVEDDDNDDDDDHKDVTVINRGSFCYFCEKKITKMKRHIFAKHAHEEDIKGMKKNAMTDEMKTRLLEITRLGDFYNNMRVIDSKAGEFKVIKNHNATYSKYGPCPCCFGFVIKKNLKKHIKTCPKGTTCPTKKGSIISESNALTFKYTNTQDSKFAKHVLQEMKDDKAKNVIMKSQNIQAVGEFLFQKYGINKPETPRQIMRLLARLLCAAREKTKKETLLLEELLDPEFFDTVVQIAKDLSGEHDGKRNREMKNPSTARRVGFAVKKAANVMKGIALRKKNQDACRKYDMFTMLVEMEWGIRINSTALATERLHKRQKPKVLPLTEDLINLTKFISKEIEKCKKLLEENKEHKTWFELCKLMFARILLFNRKRTGELGKMLVDDMNHVKHGDEINDQTIKCFSKSEKEIALHMNLIEIEGKRGTVPVLLNSEMIEIMNYLLKFRTEHQISPDNPYFFPGALDSLKAMRGHTVLRKFTLQAELKEPLAITGTQLRKFMSTSLQLLNLKENEMDWVARHLGHDIFVHRKFYRLQDDAVELAKVAKLLLMIDQGKIHQFAGQTLDDLTFNDDDDLLSDGDGDGDEDGATPTKKRNNAPKFSVTPTAGKNKGKVVAIQSVVTTPTKKVKVKQVQKRPWTDSEKNVIKTTFHRQIKKGVKTEGLKCLPKKADIEEFIQEHELDRTWREVKDFVRNNIVRLKKVKQ
ncbi:hypothetical protein WDU94_000019 [Cyamophila willieti]